MTICDDILAKENRIMNFNNQMFNPQYVNQQYYNSIRAEIEKYNYEQNKEVINAVKAMHDLCEAVKN